MFGDNIDSAFLHYSIFGFLCILYAFIEPSSYLYFVLFLLVNPVTILFYRKEYKELFSNGDTEGIVAIFSLLLPFIAIFPGLMYLNRKGKKAFVN